MEGKCVAGDSWEAEVIRRSAAGAVSGGRFEIQCHDKDGNLKWEDTIENLVVNVGLNHILSIVLAAGTQITTWYIGLTASSPSPASGDTASSHGGWTEDQNYSESVRQTFTPGAVSGQSVSNSASKAQFSINGTTTIGGCFLISNSTKGGTTGTLYSAGAFSGGNRAVVSGDVLSVQYTATQADDGV